MLAGAADRDGDVEARRDGLARQPNLLGRRVPAEVARGAARPRGALQQGGELFEQRKCRRVAEPAPSGDDHRRLFELDPCAFWLGGAEHLDPRFAEDIAAAYASAAPGVRRQAIERLRLDGHYLEGCAERNLGAGVTAVGRSDGMQPSPFDVQFHAVHGDCGLVLERQRRAKIAAEARLAEEHDIGSGLRDCRFHRGQVGIACAAR